MNHFYNKNTHVQRLTIVESSPLFYIPPIDAPLDHLCACAGRSDGALPTTPLAPTVRTRAGHSRTQGGAPADARLCRRAPDCEDLERAAAWVGGRGGGLLHRGCVDEGPNGRVCGPCKGQREGPRFAIASSRQYAHAAAIYPRAVDAGEGRLRA